MILNAQTQFGYHFPYQFSSVEIKLCLCHFIYFFLVLVLLEFCNFSKIIFHRMQIPFYLTLIRLIFISASAMPQQRQSLTTALHLPLRTFELATIGISYRIRTAYRIKHSSTGTIAFAFDMNESTNY